MVSIGSPNILSFQPLFQSTILKNVFKSLHCLLLQKQDQKKEGTDLLDLVKLNSEGKKGTRLRF